MSQRGPLTTPGDRVYQYDGTLPGWYCCVFEAVYTRLRPLSIVSDLDPQGSLLPGQYIPLEQDKAARVRNALQQKTPRCAELAETVFFSCLEQKELALLDFALLAFERGDGIVNDLTHPTVHTLIQAERHLRGEAHLLTGFVRFSDVQGRLVSTIGPKNFILPFIAPHFIDRYSREDFMIYDQTHRAALLYQNRRAEILESLEPLSFEVSEEEDYYRSLWKHFYHTVAIKERENPRCRMTHLPKRYWQYMTEMKELL